MMEAHDGEDDLVTEPAAMVKKLITVLTARWLLARGVTGKSGVEMTISAGNPNPVLLANPR